jgi:hypothetical protein
MKHCWKCSTSKSKLDFGINKSKPDGLATECRDCKRQQDREYAARNREAAKQRASEWYYKNYEYALQRNREYGKEWSRKNPAKNCASSNKRRAVKIQATPKWLTKDQFTEIEQYYVMAKELETVFPWKQHVDHIVPLKNKTVCGLHAPWNLQILSAQANFQKGNKLVI